MRETRHLCGLRNANGGFKQPTLQELHHFLFEQDYAPVHDAVADARACARCFFELDRRGLVTRPLTLAYA
jgi:DNA polymerase III epsilon subunit-like protein